MLSALVLSCPNDHRRLRTHAHRVLRAFPGLRLICAAPEQRGELRSRQSPTVMVTVRRWEDPGFDPLDLDREVAEATRGSETLVLVVAEDDGVAADCVSTALEVVTRYQRLLDARNQHSRGTAFDQVLALHRGLHDLAKPLVAADFDHARDAWRWVLRLDPDASFAVQVAALFHDVERLQSESDVRIEQHAPDYAAFKQAHAQAGGALARAALAPAAIAPALLDRIEALVAEHERPHGDPDKQLLNEADALSFFSLNACGFAAYYGPAHTRTKVAYTLARLGTRGRQALAGVRHRADVAALIREHERAPAAPVEASSPPQVEAHP
jgi:hypothetical protein